MKGLPNPIPASNELDTANNILVDFNAESQHLLGNAGATPVVDFNAESQHLLDNAGATPVVQ